MKGARTLTMLGWASARSRNPVHANALRVRRVLNNGHVVPGVEGHHLGNGSGSDLVGVKTERVTNFRSHRRRSNRRCSFPRVERAHRCFAAG